MTTNVQQNKGNILRTSLWALGLYSTVNMAYAASADDCNSLKGLAINNGVITETQFITAGKSPVDPNRMFTGAPDTSYELPAHCLVRGELDKRTRADGKENVLRFEVRLPENWEHRFIFQGGGATDGFLANAIGTTPISGSTATPALSRGYAVTSMNGGHDGVDPTFGLDQQARLDFAYAAIGKVTQVAKIIINKYYQSRPDYSYFMGCSNGGREAMIAAQRYPTEFDGVIAANPGFNLSHAVLGEVWDTQTLYKIAPEDNQGRKVLANALTEKDMNLLSSAVLEKCDANDGLKDGIINDYNNCDFKPEELICNTSNASECLPKEKVAAIKLVFDGAKDSKGNQIYSSWPYDAGINSIAWRIWKLGTSQDAAKPNALNATLGAGALNFYFMTPAQPEFNLFNFNFDEDVFSVSETGSLNDATSTMLNTFAQRGSKLMIIQGVSDPVFSANDIANWYQNTEATTANGDQEAMRKWGRLFMVPGMNHCGRGPALDNIDPLTSMQNWVEKQLAPEFLPASGKSFPGKNMPICVYPKVAKYKGTGDINSLDSYHCE